MADMEVDPPAASASGPSVKKKKQEGPRFEVKKVRSCGVGWAQLLHIEHCSTLLTCFTCSYYIVECCSSMGMGYVTGQARYLTRR